MVMVISKPLRRLHRHLQIQLLQPPMESCNKVMTDQLMVQPLTMNIRCQVMARGQKAELENMQEMEKS